jgi:5-methylthioadenosine/S-adenosylhomocysteine deaminase
VDASGRIVVPGFVNAHYHAESVLLHTITGRRSFASWPTCASLRDAEEKLRGSAPPTALEALHAVAGSFLLRHGTTCVGDFPLSYSAPRLQAARAGFSLVGIRHTVVLQSWDQIEAARDGGPSDDRRGLVSLGRMDEFTLYSLENHLRAARGRRIPLCAHAAETPGEVERFRKNFKKGILAVLKEYGALEGGTQVIHGNHLGQAEVALLRGAGANITLCPLSAVSKRTGYPLLSRLSGADVRLSLGTDWGGADMMADIRFLRMLPNLAAGIRHFSAVELLRMATINGAHALGLGAETGSLEIGKKADMVFFTPELASPVGGDLPSEEIAALIVDHLDRGAITDVLVNGQFVIREGRRATEEMTEHTEACRTLLDAFAGRGGRADGPARKGTPLLPETEEGFLPGFHTLPAEDIPFTAGGENAPAPGSSGSAAEKKIQKIFGENDY